MTSSQAQALIQQALSLAKQQKIDEAILVLTAAQQLDPADPQPHYYRGSLYAANKQLDLAETDLMQAIRLNPKYAQAYFVLGGVLHSQNQSERALLCFDRAAALGHAAAPQQAERLRRPTGPLASPPLTPDEQPAETDAQFHMLRAGKARAAGRPDLALQEYELAVNLDPGRPEPFAGMGEIYLQLGKYPEALEQLHRAARAFSDPNSPGKASVYMQRAAAYLALERVDQALADLQKSISLDPALAEAYFLRSNCNFIKGNERQGLEDLQRAIELDPDQARYHQALARFKIEKHEPEQALTSIQEALRLGSDTAAGYILRSQAYLALDVSERALADVNQALALEPRNPEALYLATVVLLILDRPAEALTAVNRLLEIEPGSPPYLAQRGRIQTRLSQHEAALQDLNQALELDPGLSAYTARGLVYHALGQSDLAEADFQYALKLDPSDHQAQTMLAHLKFEQVKPVDAKGFYERAQLYLDSGLIEPALADFSQALSLDPRYFRAYADRGQVYLFQNQYDLAISDFTEALRIQPADPDATINRGTTYARLGQHTSAITDFEHAVRLNPADARPFVLLGQSEEALGYLEDAYGHFNRAVELDHSDVEALTHRARHHARLDRRDEALDDFQRAIELAPTDPAVLLEAGHFMRQIGELAEAQTFYTRAAHLDYPPAQAALADLEMELKAAHGEAAWEELPREDMLKQARPVLERFAQKVIGPAQVTVQHTEKAMLGLKAREVSETLTRWEIRLRGEKSPTTGSLKSVTAVDLVFPQSPRLVLRLTAPDSSTYRLDLLTAKAGSEGLQRVREETFAANPYLLRNILAQFLSKGVLVHQKNHLRAGKIS